MTPIETQGHTAVKDLRKLKFSRGLPFMINDRRLPALQCYLEYPDGSMSLVMLSSDKKDFTQITDLTGEEAEQIRIRFDLN